MADEQRTSDTAGFVKDLNEQVHDWYHTAERKAALLLTLDGAFITALTAVLLAKPDDMLKILSSANYMFWLSMLVLIFSILFSVYNAIDCVRSRLDSERQLKYMVAQGELVIGQPRSLWYFQYLSLYDSDQLQVTLANARSEFLNGARVADLPALSRNVAAKHRAVNRGFIAAGVALASLLAAAVGYVLGLASQHSIWPS